MAKSPVNISKLLLQAKQCIAAGKIHKVKLIINKTLGQEPNSDSILELESTLHRAEEKSENH